jgi:hypothetical protein
MSSLGSRLTNLAQQKRICEENQRLYAGLNGLLLQE